MSVNSAPVVLPKELGLSDDAVHVMKNGMQIVYQQPTQLTYGPGQQINILFPRNTACFRNSYLTFRALTNGVGAGSYNRFSSPITSIISSLVVLWGSAQIAYITDVDVLTSLMVLCASPDWVASDGFLLMGVGTSGNRDTWAAGRTYTVNLGMICSLFNAPLVPMESGTNFQIQITLNGIGCLETDNVAASYTVDQIQYRYHIYTELPTEYQQKLKAKMDSGKGYIINYETYQNFNNQITGANINVLYPSALKSYTGCLAVMRLASTILAQGTNDKYTTSFLLNGLSQWNHKINNKYLPAANFIQGYPQSYMELKKYLGKGGRHGMIHPLFAANLYATTQFMMAADFSQSERATYEDMDEIINGLDLSQTASNSYIEIILSSALGAANQLDLFLRHNASVAITSAGYITYEK